MATIITSECINCGACEPECPNTAIYQGGVEWEFNGQQKPALSDEIFYIVPEKCTECVGFFDQEACAAVCPVDCCVPDPDRPESEEALLQRAKELHPEETFPEDFPSRFKEKKEEPAPAAAAGDQSNGAAAGAPAAAPAAAAAVAVPTGQIEKPLARKPFVKPSEGVPPVQKREFAEEIDEDYEVVRDRVVMGEVRGGRRLAKWLVSLAQPLIGAAADAAKRQLERAVGDWSFFNTSRATVRNGMLNLFLYPAVLSALGVMIGGREFFSKQIDVTILLGLTLASFEWMIRMRESIFRGVAPSSAPLRGSLYAPVGNVVARLFASAMRRGEELKGVGFDGYYDRRFDDKTERERRYGEVYRFEELSGGYLFRMEFPYRVPASSLAKDLDLGEEMPDYDYSIDLQEGYLVVRGRVADPRALKLTGVAGAFPPEFTTRVALGRPVSGFRHRYHDKLLEIALPFEPR